MPPSSRARRSTSARRTPIRRLRSSRRSRGTRTPGELALRRSRRDQAGATRGALTAVVEHRCRRAAPVEPRSSVRSIPKRGRGRVLVVDDNRINQLVVAQDGQLPRLRSRGGRRRPRGRHDHRHANGALRRRPHGHGTCRSSTVSRRRAANQEHGRGRRDDADRRPASPPARSHKIAFQEGVPGCGDERLPRQAGRHARALGEALGRWIPAREEIATRTG